MGLDLRPCLGLLIFPFLDMRLGACGLNLLLGGGSVLLAIFGEVLKHRRLIGVQEDD